MPASNASGWSTPWAIPRVWLPASSLLMEFPRWLSRKESSCQCGRYWRRGFNPWVRKIPQRRKWQLTPVFLPGEFHGQRSLAGYSSWGHTELDVTEQLSTFWPWSQLQLRCTRIPQVIRPQTGVGFRQGESFETVIQCSQS